MAGGPRSPFFRILVAEQSGSLEEFLFSFLDTTSTEIIAVESAYELQVRAGRFSPDVIFLNAGLPDLNVHQFAKTFKTTRAGRGCSIILLTGPNNHGDLPAFFDAGVDDFLKMPFAAAELLAKFRQLLRLKGLRLEVEGIRSPGRAEYEATELRSRLADAGRYIESLQAELTGVYQRHPPGASDATARELDELRQRLAEAEPQARLAAVLQEELAGLKAAAAEPPSQLQNVGSGGSERLISELEQAYRLRRYLSPTIVEKAMAASDGEPFGSQAIRKEVTLMFLDVRDFTAISDSLEPSSVSRILSEVYSELCDVILAHGGTVNKFLGDGLLAVFGDPFPLRDHRLHAVQAALEVKRRAHALCERQERYAGGFRVAIALHTGDVVLGNFGTRSQIDYTAVGHAVSVAARLLGHCQGDDIIASEATFDSLRSKIQIKVQRPAVIRGNPEPVIVAEVVGVIGSGE